MATWRAMSSLLVLRDQVDVIAPNRSRSADGLVGDTAHQGTNSDHNPHFVAGVGDNIVSALDLTHDPAHGFDSYKFAETLRQARDRRIKYVISNHRIFSSYAVGSRAAWTWGPYTGADPHTNHCHTSVLDTPISDTQTPWNLEGFIDMTPGQEYKLHVMNYRLDAILHQRNPCVVPAFTASDGSKFPGITETNHLALAVIAADDSGDPPPPPVDLDAIAKEIADQVVAQSPTVAEIAEASAQATVDEIAS
jgi:hypothetical protein